jgi:predicted patatin/cPLA2 family phospholipase
MNLSSTTRRPLRATLGKAAMVVSLSASIAVSGCALPGRLPALTVADSINARLLGISNSRFLLSQTEALTREFADSDRREIAARRQEGLHGPLPPGAMLAISGGGDDGAFGAGLLVGWTVHGDRPQFKAVTGVSTGALTAPFAFLGPQYDAQLKAAYTTTNAQKVFKRRGFLAALTSDATSDSAPLYDMVSRYLDDHMVEQIGAEYQKGRLLMIMTTNLDAGQPCIWNVGAIAASGQPGARALIIKILVASAAVPVAFPPVMFDVEVGGQHRQEMHADGGIVDQTFIYPPSIDIREATDEVGAANRMRDAYVIRNGRLIPNSANVRRRTLSIARRAVSLMITTSGTNDMYRIYLTTTRDHVGYHLAYIPPEFNQPYKGPFDRTYMSNLFQFGFAEGIAGGEWQSKPPGLAQ